MKCSIPLCSWCVFSSRKKCSRQFEFIRMLRFPKNAVKTKRAILMNLPLERKGDAFLLPRFKFPRGRCVFKAAAAAAGGEEGE